MSDQATVSDRRLAANRANAQKSTGPRTEAGKEYSRLNAVKHGRYAGRPDAALLLMCSYSDEENADRQDLREECLRCYEPADDFAAAEVEALADLRFELRRLEGVKSVLWGYEERLLNIEMLKRHRALYGPCVDGTAREVTAGGLVSVPDSFGKFCEITRRLNLARGRIQAGDFDGAASWLRSVSGFADVLWRGELMFGHLEQAKGGAEDATAAWARLQLENEIEMELREVESPEAEVPSEDASSETEKGRRNPEKILEKRGTKSSEPLESTEAEKIRGTERLSD